MNDGAPRFTAASSCETPCRSLIDTALRRNLAAFSFGLVRHWKRLTTVGRRLSWLDRSTPATTALTEGEIAMLDAAAYLQRFGYDGPLMPSVGTLRALQAAHLLAVPFENLDIHLHNPI